MTAVPRIWFIDFLLFKNSKEACRMCGRPFLSGICQSGSADTDTRPLVAVTSQGVPPVGATGGRPVREQGQQYRHSSVRENKGRASLLRWPEYKGSRGRPPVAPTAGIVPIRIMPISHAWCPYALCPHDTHRDHTHYAHKHRAHSHLRDPRCRNIARGSTCRGDRRSPGAGARPAIPAIMRAGK